MGITRPRPDGGVIIESVILMGNNVSVNRAAFNWSSIFWANNVIFPIHIYVESEGI